jgi:DNA-binding HxlR family transcriptional regulator
MPELPPTTTTLFPSTDILRVASEADGRDLEKKAPSSGRRTCGYAGHRRILGKTLPGITAYVPDVETCGDKPLCGAIQRTREVLELITDKWVINVIYALSEGTKRYSQLEREVAVVSQKMLTQTLRRLERDGLIQRRIYPVVPPRVEYSLTPLGETLVEPLNALRDWAVSHRDRVAAARSGAAAEAPVPV